MGDRLVRPCVSSCSILVLSGWPCRGCGLKSTLAREHELISSKSAKSCLNL